VLLLSLLFCRQIFAAEEQEDIDDLRLLFAELTAGQRQADGVSFMRAPLHLALLISPIFLLLPIRLFKKSYNRHTMLSISTFLGNFKPQLLLDTEKLIWNTLFSLASGTRDPFELLRQLSDALPSNDILSACTDSHWFDLGKSPVSIIFRLLILFQVHFL
jgi:hypothetical protein